MSAPGHVVLLGDSIFDNAAYTSGGPDVVTQLRDMLPAGWRATLLALDGSGVGAVAGQLARVPADATHLVVSAGGNDALGHVGLLERETASVGDGVGLLGRGVRAFAAAYADALQALRRHGRPVTLCTIYEGHFPDAHFQHVAATAVALFNDAILRTASRSGVDVIELRHVCRTPEDYANPIEPSSVGGEKIARAIVRALGLSSGAPPARVFGE